MGKQFRFIMDAKDTKEFVSYVKNDGKIFETKKHRGTIEQFEIPNYMWIKLYFCRVKIGELIYKDINDKKYIDSFLSPVIEFRNTLIRTDIKEIQRGRLYLEMRYYGSDGEVLLKSEKLDAWYKELVKWIKKHLKCVEVISNGKVVKEYVSESLVEYVKGGFKLLG